MNYRYLAYLDIFKFVSVLVLDAPLQLRQQGGEHGGARRQDVPVHHELPVGCYINIRLQSWSNVRPATRYLDIRQIDFGVDYTFSTLFCIVGLKYRFDSRPLGRLPFLKYRR